MIFAWIDYTEKDLRLIDEWLDEEAQVFTGMDDGFGAYYDYWVSEEDTRLGENFWVKVFCRDGVPAGLAVVSFWDGVFTVSEFLVAPALRRKGVGSAALQELLERGQSILGKTVVSAKAVIYPNNIASQKTFTKAGFHFEQVHPDGDAWYYRYDRFSFVPIDRKNVQDILPRLFEILHGNMNVIAPTGNSYAEDEELWISCIAEALEKPARQLLLLMDGGVPAGFFMYYVNGDLWMMEEIQFAPAYQGSGLFRALYAHMVSVLPDSVEFVEAYANKHNQKSQGVLTHLGLTIIGENHNGNSYRFRGTYSDLKEAIQ